MATALSNQPLIVSQSSFFEIYTKPTTRTVVASSLAVMKLLGCSGVGGNS